MTNGRVNGSDLYRAALVHSIAAIDAYVHGVVLDHGVDILLGRRIHQQAKGGKVGLHFTAIRQILSATNPADQEISARTHIAQRLALETFQGPDSIAGAFSMVGISKLWSTAFPMNTQGAMTALSLIVQRRNRIVHQCDADPLSPGSITPIDDSDALSSIMTVENTVLAISAVV